MLESTSNNPSLGAESGTSEPSSEPAAMFSEQQPFDMRNGMRAFKTEGLWYVSVKDGAFNPRPNMHDSFVLGSPARVQRLEELRRGAIARIVKRKATRDELEEDSEAVGSRVQPAESQPDSRLDIDTTFDFRSDTPPGKDPDTFSKTLRRYHRHLWSKPLPNGDVFVLRDDVPRQYLHHRSPLGEFSLSSDAVIPTFKWSEHIRNMIPQSELEAFNALGYTIGGMMVFPAYQVDGKWTINQARGCTKLIADRFDLTLECIRRHYLGLPSPLGSTLARYDDFFKLFKNFRGYVEFFLLDDGVSEDHSAVRIAEPFDDFKSPPIPQNIREYEEYRSAAVAFIRARNERISRWCEVHAHERYRPTNMGTR